MQCHPLRHALALTTLCVACGNVSTLQTAVPMVTGKREHSLQGWVVPSNQPIADQDKPLVLAAYGFREGRAWGEWGARLSAPFNIQLDAKTATVGPRLAASIGAGVGTDLGSLILAGLSTDDTDELPLTLDVFVPAIVSLQVIPEYVSVHAVLRPQLWVFSSVGDEDKLAELSALSAGGLRVGKDFGIHLEASPIWTTGRGLGWTAAAALFLRLEPNVGSSKAGLFDNAHRDAH